MLSTVGNIKKHINRLLAYEKTYEQSANRPVQFLRFIKNEYFPQGKDIPNLTKHNLLALAQEINMQDITKLLSEIHITHRGKRQAGNELLLTLIPSSRLQKSLEVLDVDRCDHISCVKPDRVWVSNGNNLLMTDTAFDEKLHSVEDSLISFGVHTVNNFGELIYIHKDYSIKKLSGDMKTTTTMINNTDDSYEPWCVHWSPFSGNILVGMRRHDTSEVKIMRYNNTEQSSHTIQNKIKSPFYISENVNGDIVVSDRTGFDSGAVVVTSREGIYRFSYKGPPTGSGLSPRGICTDALSHILVCDDNTHSLHLLDRNGTFLSYLLIKHQPGLYEPKMDFKPRSLSYDINKHQIWVGSLNDKSVSVFRIIDRSPTRTGKSHLPNDCSKVETNR